MLFRPVHLRIPALAAYSPAQAVLFVRLAAGSLYRRITRWCVASLIALVTCWLLGAPAFLVVPLITSNGVVQGIAQGASAFVIILVPFFALIVRDLLLTRRASAMLKRASRCRKCRAAIDLHTADERLAITCHACHTQFKLPHPIGALTSRSDETLTLVESHARSRRRTIAATIGGVLTTAIAGNEVFIHTQAARAAKDIVSPAQLAAFCNEGLPASHDPNADGAWQLLQSAEQVRVAFSPETRNLRTIKLDLLLQPPAPADNEFDRSSQLQALKIARDALLAAEQSGAFAVLDQIADSQDLGVPNSFRDDIPLLVQIDAEPLQVARGFSKLNAGRLAAAINNADIEQARACVRTSMTLARMCRHSPGTIGLRVCHAIEWNTTILAWRALDLHPSLDQIHALGAELNQEPTQIETRRAIDSERMLDADLIARVFATPAHARLGLLSAPDYISDGWPLPPNRLGTYASNLDELTRRCAAATDLLKIPPHLRAVVPPDPSTFQPLAPIRFCDPYFINAVRSADQLEAFRRANGVRIALELSFATNGRYPSTLDALVPAFLPELPLDPWSNKPFGYSLHANATSPDAAFILYTTGTDGKDDSGREHPTDPWLAFTRQPSTTADSCDFILNRFHP